MGIINEMVGDGESSSKPEPKGGFGSNPVLQHIEFTLPDGPV